MHKVRSFIRLGIKNQWLFIQAFILSGVFRFEMMYLPFKYLKKQMGIPRTDSSFEVPDCYYQEANKVKRIVLLACEHTPWESKCLVRAMLVQYFLKRKHIPTTIYLGVNKDELNHMKAHAWIRCGNMIVTGEYEKAHFVEVAKFSNEKII